MSILGNRVRAGRGPEFLTVGGTYVADLRDRARWRAARHLRPLDHGPRASSPAIDVERGKSAPGVVGVFTAADLDLAAARRRRADAQPGHGAAVARHRPGALRRRAGRGVSPRTRAGSRRRRAGVGRLRAAAGRRRPRGGRRRRGRCCSPRRAPTSRSSSTSGATTTCSTAARSSSASGSSTSASPPCPLEVRGRRRRRGPTTAGSTVWARRRTPTGSATRSPACYGLDAEQVRVVAPDVGGGFGAKIGAYARGAAAAVAGPPGRPAGALDRDPHREHARAWATAGARSRTSRSAAAATARSQAYRLTVIQDAGAYPALGALPAVPDPDDGAGHLRHPEGRVQHARRSSPTRRRSSPTAAPAGPRPRPPSSGRWTCSPPRSAWTRPRCGGATSSGRSTRPYTTPVGTIYDCGDYARRLDLALEAAGYDELRAEQAAPAGRRRRRSRSASACRLRRGHRGPTAGGEYGAVEVARRRRRRPCYTGRRPTARATTRRGRCSSARSSASRWSASGSCTATPTSCPRAAGTIGSRSVQLGGVGRARRPPSRSSTRPASWPPSCSRRPPTTSCSTRATARFHVAGTPAVSRSLGRGRGRGRRRRAARRRRRLRRAPARRSRSAPTSPSSRSTPRPARSSSSGMVAVDDAGRILNPLLADGQVHGGIAQGVGPGAARGVRLRRRRQPAHVEPRRLRHDRRRPSCRASSSSRWRRRRR